MDLLPTSTSKQCELKYWVFRLCKGPFIVRVQGYREVPGEYKKLECWLTSPVTYCDDARTVVTARGTRYVLKGSMDVDQAIIFNYPDIVIDAFKNGFPTNWERVLKHLHCIMNLTESMNTSVQSEDISIDDEPEKEKVPPKAAVKKADSIKQEANKNNCRALCATNSPATLSVSRSGRVIKPRLRTWEGERISYDAHGNAIAAHSSTTKAPGRPEFSTKLAAICDGMGVNKLESSKQTHRRSTVFEPPQKTVVKREKIGKKCGKTSATRPLVEYPISDDDDEDADSFMAYIDRISLTPPPQSLTPQSRSPSPRSNSDELTPIPLKNYRARRIIDSNVRPNERKRAFKKEKSTTSTISVKRTPTRNATKGRAKTASKKTKVEEKPLVKIVKIPSPQKATPKKKRWTVEETKRLKIALKAAVNPQSDQDWEIIARSVSGGVRSGNECREQAVKIRWKPPACFNEMKPSGSGGATSSADTENSAPLGNAKKKTAAKKSAGGSNADFFTENKYEVSLLDLDPDDSLLSMLKTPVEEAKFTRKPFLMKQVLNETRRSARTNNSSFNDTL